MHKMLPFFNSLDLFVVHWLWVMTVITAAGTVLLLASFLAVNRTINSNVLMTHDVSSTTEISVKHDYDHSDGAYTWEPPGRLKEWFPFHKLGPDYEGAPVFLCPFGQWNLRKLFSLGTQAEKSGMQTYVKFINERFIRDSSTSEHGRGVVIYDWEGFSLASHSNREALRMALAILRALAESQKSLSYGFFINTSMAASSFLNLSMPFPGSYLDKFEIYGSSKANWQPIVLSKIPADSLPTQYGGTKNHEF